MSGFLVKLDENLGRLHAELLREHGYDADRVHDEGISGAKDPDLWAKVVAEGRFLITLDLDFSDIRRFRPGSHPGILLVRAGNNSRTAVLNVLRRVLAEHPLESLQGCLAVADRDITRIRRA
jgi:predicted nuclease of predicted toxin-antitoxin system